MIFGEKRSFTNETTFGNAKQVRAETNGNVGKEVFNLQISTEKTGSQPQFPALGFRFSIFCKQPLSLNAFLGSISGLHSFRG